MGNRGSPGAQHYRFPGLLAARTVTPNSPRGSVSWTPRSSLARSWAWAPSAPESASSPGALPMPARLAGCIPEGWGVKGMGGAWCERCWVCSWCWRAAGGESRGKGLCQDGCWAGGSGCSCPAAALDQPGTELGEEGQDTTPGCPQPCCEGHRIPPPRPSCYLHPPCDRIYWDGWGMLPIPTAPYHCTPSERGGVGTVAGRGLTYPDRRVQVGHSHLLRTLHGLDHLLLVLRERGGSGHPRQGPQRPQGVVSAGDEAKPAPPSPARSRDAPRAPRELCVQARSLRAHPPPETGTG